MSTLKSILVIGGAGYIGSHMVRKLREHQYTPIVFDNLSTGHASFVPGDVQFVKGDLRKKEDIAACFEKYPVHTVMHFAALSIVPDSVREPEKYKENNVNACEHLFAVMAKHKVRKFIFSSSASVYGEPKEGLLTEESKTEPVNPYGQNKLDVENRMKELARSGELEFISLRYFNAAGAHSSGEIGERHDPETHLIPIVLKAAMGAQKEVTIFGDNYETPDGTCIRDYVHVDDLCEAHLLALNALDQNLKNEIINLGSGNGFSVRDVIRMCEKVTGKALSVKIAARRAGDPPRLVADTKKAAKFLNWKPKHSLESIITAAWHWEMYGKKIYV